jgi:predicted nucleic acid-binding protein
VRLSAAGTRTLTSSLVLAETATRLRYDAGVPTALEFREVIGDAIAAGRLAVRYADPELDRKAWALMERYADHVFSFTDCAGAVTAREGRAEAVLGLDTDFTVLGFALEP